MLFRSFFSTRPDSFLVLSPILPIPGTRTDSTIFRYSPGVFFGTLTDSTYSRHSHGFYHFPVLTKILPFSVVARTVFQDSHGFYLFPVLARILPFFGTHKYSIFFGTLTDSTCSRNSHGFYHFSVLTRTVFWYSKKFYIFPALARILPFSGTHPDSFLVL